MKARIWNRVKKSYAVSFLLQDESATLNDKQIDKFMQKLIGNLQNKLGAVLDNK